ncbi:MAG: peptidase M3, partial [Bacteroidales bacterium]|nr:peptidase M3 [Bacteroidales bacterium]
MKKLLIVLVLGLFIISCNTNQQQMQTDTNPFFAEYGTPFEVPVFDQINPEHYMPAFKEGMKQQLAEIDAIVNITDAPTFENTIVARDLSGELLTNVSSVFFNTSSAVTNEDIQKISKEVAPLLSAHRDNIALNEKLFEKVKIVYEQKENLELNTEQKMLLDKTYKSFVRGGANLAGDEKTKFRGINKELSILTVQFGENLLAETNDFQLVIDNKDDLSGLPQYVIDMGADDANAAGMEGKWLFTLNKPSLIPFLQYADNRELREKIFKAYTNRGNNDNDKDNKAIAAKIASLRVERANLLGYKTHAHYVLDENMAKNPENVYKLMDQVWEAAVPMAKQEAIELQKMIDAEEGGFQLEAWDWWYYTEKLRKQKYDLDDEQLKPYFELSNVRQGMFTVANNLWGLTFKVRDDLPKPHKDAIAYEVFDTDGTHQAIL